LAFSISKEQPMTEDQTIQRALKILGRRMRSGSALSFPGLVRD